VIDKLPASLVEDGREHPFTSALVRDITSRRTAALQAIEGMALTGAPETLRYHAARAAAFREVIDVISNAKGSEEV
jgi:hypothetical protein